MKKFGTPMGAAPGVAKEKVGLAGVGTPPSRRRGALAGRFPLEVLPPPLPRAPPRRPPPLVAFFRPPFVLGPALPPDLDGFCFSPLPCGDGLCGLGGAGRGVVWVGVC